MAGLPSIRFECCPSKTSLRDMIRHCGQHYTVLRRVERIIDDATGEMLEMATPCLLLTEASGEFLRFCAQHEYPFWREVWLSRDASVTAS